MTSTILSAVNVLTKPLGEASGRDTHSSQQGALLAALQANRALLLEQLQGDRGLEEVRRLREEARAGVTWFSPDAEDPTWSFVQECLLLLLALARHLSIQLELFGQTPAPSTARLRTPEMAPPLPPDVLSVSQQKALGAALQFVVSLGLCPYLAPGVGLPLGRRSAFGAMVEGLVRRDVAPAVERRLLTTAGVLLKLAELSSLATLLYTRHLGDVMAALCQLGHRPHRPDGGGSAKEGKYELSIEERKTCREALQSLLGKVYQPIVIKELLILQGGPKQAPPAAGSSSGRATLAAAPPWLRRLCGQLLSDRLTQPSGVQWVVRAILEGGAGGDSDWRKCDGVAKILAACPQQSVSPDSYYRQVCPQILELLHFKDKLTAQQFQRVATRAALTMVEEKPQFAQQYLLAPLLGPLQRCGRPNGEAEGAVEEWELTRCVDDVYKIWVVGNSQSAPLLKALGEVLPVVFSLFCFTKQNVSHLRGPCQEILLWYLGNTEPPAALAALWQLSGLAGQTDGQTDGETGGQTYGVAPEFHFTPGGEGGAKLSLRESISDEDDGLYERLSEEQWGLECLVQLLAELKDSDLPGDFFLGLLQELTSWAAEEEEEQEEELDVSAMSLLEVEQRLLGRAAGRGRRLALLQVLAVVCEGLPHTLLLRKTIQVVDFMVSLLQRACVGLDQVSGSGSAVENPVESQTLSMAIGLVATLLSGPQLSAEDFSPMSRLLPPLEELSQKHPEVFIQELASDLRAAIATRGAYRPQNLARAAQRPTDPGPRNTNNLPSKKKPKIQPLTTDSQVSQANPHSSKTQINSSTPTTHIQGNTSAPAQQTETQGQHTAQPQAEPLIPGHIGHTKPPGGPAHGGSVPERGKAGGGQSPDTGDPAPRPSKAFSDWLLEACDPEVPTRAVALRALTRMTKEGNAEAVQAQEKLLMLFLENLEHEDSFVYLSAIQGLAVLADSYPERILQRLLGEYQHGPSLPSSDKQRSLETRLKIGEVLMRASRAMGELAPHLGRPLVGVLLRGSRDQDQTVRASCLSNLGELCQRLDYSLGPLATELSSCLTALIKTEKEVEVRRAAVHVITLLLRGLSDKTTQVLGDVLLDLYRALKWVVRSDRDDVTVLHAKLALEELDDVMKKFIFPKQKLEKKIVVLP